MFSFFKSQEVNLVNKEELISTLTRITEILRDNGYSAQADAVRRPLGFLTTGDELNCIKYLTTVDIWGGSGAAWEVGYFQNTNDEVEFRKCFIRLALLMHQSGFKFSRADDIAEAFEKMLT
jgi:hypothetical protein